MLHHDTAKWLYYPAGASLLAILPLPYEYYLGLRPVLWISAALVAWTFYAPSKKATWLVWALLAIALAYNPIIPLHLDRWLWFPINLYSAALFAWLAYTNPFPSRISDDDHIDN